MLRPRSNGQPDTIGVCSGTSTWPQSVRCLQNPPVRKCCSRSATGGRSRRACSPRKPVSRRRRQAITLRASSMPASCRSSRRGRHRYFALAGPHVGELIEAVARVAPPQRITSLRQGTRAHSVVSAMLLRPSRRSGGRRGRRGTLEGELRVDLRRCEMPRRARRRCEAGRARARMPRLDRAARPHRRPARTRLLTRLLELGWLTRDAGTRALRLSESAGRSSRHASVCSFPDGLA